MDDNLNKATPPPIVKDSLQYLLDEIQVESRKYLAILPTEARRILVDPRGFEDVLDSVFLENIRKMSIIYEALQNCLAGVDERNDTAYPSVQELTRHIAIHKRSVSDRTPMYTESELLQYLTVLASQVCPFIHIVRKMERTKDGELTFQTKFVAPTEDRKNRVLLAYSTILLNSGSILKNMMQKELEENYLRSLKQTLTSVAPEVRIGRIDYELRKLFITKQMLGPDFTTYIKHVQVVNNNLNQKIYKPLILGGIQSRVLITFNCEDIRAPNKEKFKKFYDIVHFEVPSYLSSRLEILLSFLNKNFFRDWWDKVKEDSLLQSRELNQINENQFNKEMVKSILERLKINADVAPIHLINLCLEILKLIEWRDLDNSKREEDNKINIYKAFTSLLLNTGKLLLFKDKKLFDNYGILIVPALKGEIPNVLACTYPYISPSKIDAKFNPFKSKRDIYLILKDKKITANAIDLAIELFEKNGDKVLLYVLENIFNIHNEKKETLKNYIPTYHLTRLEEYIIKAYKDQIPWWQKLINSLIGKELDKHQIQRLKQLNEIKEQEKQKESIQNAKLTNNDRSLNKNDSNLFDQKINLTEKKLIEKTCEYLDKQWKAYQTPNKKDLLNLSGEEVQLMTRLLNFVNLNAISTKAIARIVVMGGEDIYITREYAIKNRQDIIEFFTKRIKEEETFKINNKIFISTNQSNKNFYLSIIENIKLIN